MEIDMNNPNILIDSLNAELISNTSPRHIQSVIEDLIEVAQAGNKLAESVSHLNPECAEIGHGRLLQLIDLANDVKTLQR